MSAPGPLDSAAALAAFVRAEIDRHSFGAAIRELQGHVKEIERRSVMAAKVEGRLGGPPGIVRSYPAGAITAVTRTGAGAYTLTHLAGVQGVAPAGVVTPEGQAGAGATAQFQANSATSSFVRTYNAAAALTDEIFYILLIG